MAIVNVAPDVHALALNTAHRIAALLTDAIARSGVARFCLTGGQTPGELYGRLGARADADLRRVDWTRVELFWGDERHVPPEHPDSNYGLAQTTLLAPTNVPPVRIHRIRGEITDAAEAAAEYDEVVRHYERTPARTFDVMLLGLGTDAHIASLFPGSPLLKDVARPTTPPQADRPRAAAVWAPHLNAWRLTLTPSTIVDSDAILVLTAGASKREAVHAALRGPDDIERWPAQWLRVAGSRVEWWLDHEAASSL
jgi:6-phosphogluconolactonase